MKMIKNIFTKKIIILLLFSSAMMISLVNLHGDIVHENMLDVPYEPTHFKVVEAMLKLGKAGPGDITYDLGCGDGRIAIMAVRKFGVKHAYGVDINPQRLKEANERAKAFEVTSKVTFMKRDFFKTDFTRASLITAYLLDHINLKLRPHLFMQCRPGTRIVTHEFHMHDWEPDKIGTHPYARGQRITLWIIPAKVGGTWNWSTKTRKGIVKSSLNVNQVFQKINGSLRINNEKSVVINRQYLRGKNISFTANTIINSKRVTIAFKGTVESNIIKGTQKWTGGPYRGTYKWRATRKTVNNSGRWKISLRSKSKFTGVIDINRKGNKVAAKYFPDSKKDLVIDIRDIYIWGSSIYFRVPLNRYNWILFKGSLKDRTGSGKAFHMRASRDYKEGIYDPETVVWNDRWSARKK